MQRRRMRGFSKCGWWQYDGSLVDNELRCFLIASDLSGIAAVGSTAQCWLLIPTTEWVTVKLRLLNAASWINAWSWLNARSQIDAGVFFVSNRCRGLLAKQSCQSSSHTLVNVIATWTLSADTDIPCLLPNHVDINAENWKSKINVHREQLTLGNAGGSRPVF